MVGPFSLQSSKVNELLRDDALAYSRVQLLLRVEIVYQHMPVSMRDAFVQAMLVEQAARDAGLESSEISASSIDEDTRNAVKRHAIEIGELLMAAGFMSR